MTRNSIFALLLSAAAALPAAAADVSTTYDYQPTAENLQAREAFADRGFGVFIHWGIYSMFGQGEWYLNRDISATEYAKAAAAFYPANFDARAWVKAIKAAGGRYICFTTRHHDGFSMWHTAQSPYNIVDATPFKRDVVKELADACHEEGIALHLYYSHIDWTRPDYPSGRTGLNTGRDVAKRDWPHYYAFMNRQLTELLTNYGEIGAIWFDGWWDHDEDATPFDWQLPEQYALIHSLQPQCLIGNNHHQVPFPGEDIQIFERDLPGENTAGLSGQAVTKLPLETCQTMNGMWGYKVADQDYKDTATLIHYLIGAAGRGANLLLNVGPQPDGSIPETALQRFAEMGRWMDRWGYTIYGTRAGDVEPQPWGATTRRDNTLYVHVTDNSVGEVYLPARLSVSKAVNLSDGSRARCTSTPGGMVVSLPQRADSVIDHIVALTLR
jgi:alpha-L-fucosidase